MAYLSVKEVAEKRGISNRRAQKLYIEQRIPGVIRFSRVWALPKGAKKPITARKESKQGGAYDEIWIGRTIIHEESNCY